MGKAILIIGATRAVAFALGGCLRTGRENNLREAGSEAKAARSEEVTSSSRLHPRTPVLSNPEFTVEELPIGEVRYEKAHLPLANRLGRKSVKPEKPGSSLVWLSSFTIFAMNLGTSEAWAVYSAYDDWSAESYDMAHYRYPEVLLPVSMGYIVPFNRILVVDLIDAEITGYFELPRNLAGVYVLENLGGDKYFALSYQGDDSLRLSLLHLGSEPSVERAVVFRSIGLPSRRGYCVVDAESGTVYLNVRGLLVVVRLDDLKVVKTKECYEMGSGQLLAMEGRNELFLLSTRSLTLVDPQTLDAVRSYELPKQPALRDDIDAKSGQVLVRKGEPMYLRPSGVTYRGATEEFVVTFSYSPRMLLIDSDSGKQRFLEFGSSSDTVGMPIYLDEAHLIIGGHYVYSFVTGETKKVSEARGTMLVDAHMLF